VLTAATPPPNMKSPIRNTAPPTASASEASPAIDSRVEVARSRSLS
jgi:hypothetical protein